MKTSQLLRQLSTAAQRTLGEPHVLTRPSAFIRPLSPNAVAGPSRPSSIGTDFQLYPDFFGEEESRQLLAMALWKLDRVDSTRRRRRNKGLWEESEAGGAGLQSLFHGEYGFEEGHYDSVIHQYRETLLSSFPPPDKAWPDLSALMKRIYDLLPVSEPGGSYTQTGAVRGTHEQTPRGTSTHLLHLAPHGAILPHVDNLEASGSVIIGTSLGAERILRLKEKGGEEGWDIRLPSGSLYIQRDTVRYQYDHSILPYDDTGSAWQGKKLEPGHRISLMVRVSWSPGLRVCVRSDHLGRPCSVRPAMRMLLRMLVMEHGTVLYQGTAALRQSADTSLMVQVKSASNA
ncbi:uncharacterized protein MKK02DRAFT_16941 [Dioszegia hungarica]|uniref:Alpha-ketoglutarate-dependent dioxygenase AlkB-like domain-containing protein n=1 Tax=Dioszegia hungarica TaxID=4972 RepID=A0AA38H7P0_9TREE|nr:uncharacterized protein MKK02DRAFT_16941 [Dioszegia hungarica]KAI9634459.1 hypothetical protein MKK02DRAFT_16941 [Dioszegia hungarica]